MSYDNLFHGSSDFPNHTQWRIKAESLLPGVNIFKQTATKKFPLGAIAETRDGRRFRYVRNGGATSPKAAMTQSAAPIANNLEQVQTYGTALVVGDKQVTMNLAATTTKDQFIDGYLMGQDVIAAAIGDLYIIKGNTATISATANYTTIIDIADEGGIRTAAGVTADLTVVKNMYADVIVVPAAAATGVPTGVPMIDLTAAYFGWVQTRGPAALLIDTDTVVVGDQVGEPDDTNVAGGAGIHAVTFPIYGTVLSKPTNTQTDQPAIVNLCIE